MHILEICRIITICNYFIEHGPNLMGMYLIIKQKNADLGLEFTSMIYFINSICGNCKSALIILAVLQFFNETNLLLARVYSILFVLDIIRVIKKSTIAVILAIFNVISILFDSSCESIRDTTHFGVLCYIYITTI